MIALPDNVRFANKRLEELYGYARGNNALYRIVWANDQTERRFGRFNEFHGEIFLRTTVDLHTVPKYWWCPECWILERYVVLPIQDKDGISTEGYEPIWVFRTDQGVPLPIRWDVVAEIAYFNFHGHPSPQFAVDDRQAVNEHDRTVKKEQKMCREQLDNESSDLISGLSEGSAILSAGHPGKE